MNAHTASLINAVLLIALSAWGYFSSQAPSMTALIPALFGVLLLLCYPGVKAQNKIVAHVAVVLTVVIVVALIMPLQAAIGRSDGTAMARIGIMLISSLFAVVFFVKSFIDARRAKA
ncbi:MAG: hypothetical protein AAGB11_01405 [Pseudomonadota bacterium]